MTEGDGHSRMKIRMVEVDGLRCPFVVCEGCGSDIDMRKKSKEYRPVVLTRRENYPAFHPECDPREPGHRSLVEFMEQLMWNSLGLELSEDGGRLKTDTVG
jgi:hypothetical protein